MDNILPTPSLPLQDEKPIAEIIQETGYRDGIAIEKGVPVTTDFLEQNYEKICNIMDFFISYPDCFLDMIRPADCPIRLFFYQRISKIVPCHSDMA